MYVIETQELSKYYSRGRIKALDSCTLRVEEGKIFSLLGPNGAGKTTLIKLLIGIIHPNAGTATLFSEPITNYRVHEKIGYLAENHRFPEFLSVGQILHYYGKMSGLSKDFLQRRIPEMLELVKLSDRINMKVRKLSKGMTQRLGLAHALLHDPQLLFLDEPTDGIDPVGRREIRDLLKQLRDRGKTIFVNSHLLSEVERMSDEIAILKDGKLLQQGTVDSFISIRDQYQIDYSGNGESFARMCTKLDVNLETIRDKSIIAVRDDQQLNHLVDAMRASDLIIKAIIPRKISLEDYFIDVIEENGDQKQ